MKKTLLIIAGIATLTLTGCGASNSTTNGTGSTAWTGVAANTDSNSSFGIESCDKYAKLMDCVMGKVPEAQKEQTQKMYDDAMKARKALPTDQLKQVCDTTMTQLETMKDTYKAMGCEM